MSTQKITSFLMAGQSNMAGRGALDDVTPIENPLCYMLRMGRWQTMREPINPDRAICGIECPSGVSLGDDELQIGARTQGIRGLSHSDHTSSFIK